MFLFSRVATLQGPPAETMAWATEMTEIVNKKDGPKTTLWQNLFGAPLGTYSWYTLVNSRAQMAELMGSVVADPEFHERVADAQKFVSTTPTRDYLRKYVGGTKSDGTPEIGSVAEMVTATPAPGRFLDAMAFGPEMAVKVGEMISHTTSFYADAYGTFGQVTWITMYPDFAATDEAQDKLMNSADYLGDVAKGSDLFVAGSGLRGFDMRIA